MPALVAVALAAGCATGEQTDDTADGTVRPSRSGPATESSSAAPSQHGGDAEEAEDGEGEKDTGKDTGKDDEKDTGKDDEKDDERNSGKDGGKAADGGDLSACRDATCEVVVRESADIPLDGRFGCESFHVTVKAPDTVSFVVLRPEYGNLTGYIRGTGYLSLANGVTMTVVRVDGSDAELRFEPKAEDRHNDRARGSKGLGIYNTA